LFWLFQQSLDYLEQITFNPCDPLYSEAIAYLNIRPHLVKIAEHYIPLQQRASEDDTFLHLREAHS